METESIWSPRQVRRGVLKETIQHPLTLFFGASAIMSGLYIGLISGSPEGLMLTLGAMGLSLGSWIFNYFIRSEHFVQQYFEKWQKLKEAERQKNLEGLKKQFVELDFKEGIQEYDDLTSAHQRFRDYLRGSGTQGLTQLQQGHLEGVAAETFSLGGAIVRSFSARGKLG
jgi:hypothetical protein